MREEGRWDAIIIYRVKITGNRFRKWISQMGFKTRAFRSQFGFLRRITSRKTRRRTDEIRCNETRLKHAPRHQDSIQYASQQMRTSGESRKREREKAKCKFLEFYFHRGWLATYVRAWLWVSSSGDGCGGECFSMLWSVLCMLIGYPLTALGKGGYLWWDM